MDSEEWEDKFFEDDDPLEERKGETAMTDREERHEDLEPVAGRVAMGGEQN